ncbi:hypothetical protein [Halomonas sp. GT]|uniref:hypothetical protein n=1 Tax=Halomonas sp. GT TaxID=1971364 RepID=UPI0012ECB926|nr:hypothetical protein [Halomonas sp. GT]
MDFFKGVFNRKYEEAHYLEKALVSQHVSFLMKSHALAPYATSISAGLSSPDFLTDHMKLPDWAERSASIASEYQDPLEAARKAALGDSSYYLDQHLASSNLAGQVANGFSSSTIESFTRDLTSSEAAYKAATGTSLSSASEAVAGLTKNYTSLLDDDVRESLKGHHASIRDAIAPQYADIPESESRLPSVDIAPFKYIDEQNARLRKEQNERDEWLKKQAENSDKQLHILAAQVEEGKRSQSAQSRSNVFALLLAGAALLVSILTGFWDAEELRAMVMGVFEDRSE